MGHFRSFSRTALAITVPLIGCYTYTVALPGAGTPTGAEVHIAIDPGATGLIAAALGPRVQTVDGRTVAADDSTLTVSVRTITRTLGSEENWNGDAVRIPRAALARVEVRHFDVLKTGIIAGGIVAAAVVAGHAGTSAPTTAIRTGGSSGQQ